MAARGLGGFAYAASVCDSGGVGIRTTTNESTETPLNAPPPPKGSRALHRQTQTQTQTVEEATEKLLKEAVHRSPAGNRMYNNSSMP